MTAVRSDLTIEQNWEGYSEEEHAIWRLLFERQQRLLVGRACLEYLEGLAGLGVAADGIPDFQHLNDILDEATGWQIVAVPGSHDPAQIEPEPAGPRIVKAVDRFSGRGQDAGPVDP